MDKLAVLFYNNKIVVKIYPKSEFTEKNLFFCRNLKDFSNSSRIEVDSK